MGTLSVCGYDSSIFTDHEPFFDDVIEEPCEIDELQMPSQSWATCAFLKMPYEVRSQIYSYVLPRTINKHERGVVWCLGTTAILATRRQIYRECISLMYRNCIFSILVYDEQLEFCFQWQQSHGTQLHYCTYNFPGPVAQRNRALMCKFDVRVRQMRIDSSSIKYNCSDPAVLAIGLSRQVAKLCETLIEVYVVRRLDIFYLAFEEATDRVKSLVLGPFSTLKNTLAVSISSWPDTDVSYERALQAQLSDAYTRNSLLRLPLEVRELIYHFTLPHTVSHGKGGGRDVKWYSGDPSILRTCRQIYVEASRVLYATNEFEFSWMLEYAAPHRYPTTLLKD